MKIEDLMTREVVSVTPNATLKIVAETHSSVEDRMDDTEPDPRLARIT